MTERELTYEEKAELIKKMPEWMKCEVAGELKANIPMPEEKLDAMIKMLLGEPAIKEKPTMTMGDVFRAIPPELLDEMEPTVAYFDTIISMAKEIIGVEG